MTKFDAAYRDLCINAVPRIIDEFCVRPSENTATKTLREVFGCGEDVARELLATAKERFHLSLRGE